MTNEMIILLESVKLMEEGILKPTRKVVTVEDAEGNVKKVKMPEEIHTYSAWKSKGYQVQKGQKAIAQFPVWKMVVKKSEEEDKPDTQKMYMKNAHFFTKAQVEKIGK